MTSIQPRFTTGPRTYTAGETIDGGQLVEARAGGVIGVAAAGSLKVLGVAQKPATPGGGAPRQVDANLVLDQALAPSEVAVLNREFVPVKYAAAAAFGDRLVAAAGGTVTPAGAAPDARSVVGWCAELNGVALGAVGLTKINL